MVLEEAVSWLRQQAPENRVPDIIVNHCLNELRSSSIPQSEFPPNLDLAVQ